MSQHMPVHQCCQLWLNKRSHCICHSNMFLYCYLRHWELLTWHRLVLNKRCILFYICVFFNILYHLEKWMSNINNKWKSGKETIYKFGNRERKVHPLLTEWLDVFITEESIRKASCAFWTECCRFFVWRNSATEM